MEYSQEVRILHQPPVWDERLITRSRAADLCGTWEIKMDYPQPDVSVLRCNICDGMIQRLPDAGKLLTIDGLIGTVLGHMVKSHGYTLSGAPQGGSRE